MEELTAKKSPRLQLKQEQLQKMKSVAHKYTINKKEWVLNPMSEAPTNSEEAANSPTGVHQGKQFLHR